MKKSIKKLESTQILIHTHTLIQKVLSVVEIHIYTHLHYNTFHKECERKENPTT